MMAVRSSKYFRSHWTGLMRREGRSQEWAREEASQGVFEIRVKGWRFRDQVSEGSRLSRDVPFHGGLRSRI